MTQIKPDGIILSNLTTPLMNYATSTTTLTISGTVANGANTTKTATLSLTRSNTLVEVFAENQNTGKKMSLMSGTVHHPYQPISSETHAHSVTFSGSTLTISVTITNNTGGDITLTSQVWTITAVLYDVPYS